MLHVSGEAIKAFLNTYTHHKGRSFTSLFPSEDDEWIHLLKKMLEFNPFFRSSAEELRNHPYFSDLHHKSKLEGEFIKNTNLDKINKLDTKNGKNLEATGGQKVAEWVFDRDARLTHVIHEYKMEQREAMIAEGG